LGANNKRKTTEEFIKELRQINSKVIVVGKYINAKTKIKCQCVFCGEIFDSLPETLLRGGGHKPCSFK
jgi:hypothetical protein